MTNSAPVKDVFCGYDALLNDAEKVALNELTLSIFRTTPLQARPKPSTLVSIIISRKTTQ